LSTVPHGGGSPLPIGGSDLRLAKLPAVGSFPGLMRHLTCPARARLIVHRLPLSRLLAALLPVCALASVGHASDLASVAELKRLSLEELMSVEITSVSGYNEKLTDAASAVQVVTGEEIRRSGATTLPEALRLAPNLNVAQKNSHDWGISARGFNTELANKLLVLMDGRTLYTPLFSGVRWDVQDYLLQDLARIEVISGPGSTLWGVNAVNGVINITSKPAADTQGWYVEGLGGVQFGQGFGIRYGGTLTPTAQYRVYAKYTDREGEVFANGLDAPDAWDRAQTGFRIDADTGADTRVTVQGDAYTGTEGFPEGGAASVNGGNLLGRWSRNLADGSDMRLQFYVDHTHLRQPATSPFAASGFFTDDLDTYNLDFQHHLTLADRHELVWGLGYRLTQDRSISAPSLGFDPANLSQQLFSAFAQDEITLAPNVSATIGTKLEHTSYTGYEVEPGVRLQWKVASDDLLWLAVSRAVRTPSRVDREIRQPSQTIVVLQGSEDFRSETLIAYEAGYRAQFGSQFYTSFATFYNRYDHIRSARLTPTTIIPIVFANDLEGDTYGFELTANYQPIEWWRLTAGFNLLKEDLRVKTGGTDLNNALNETSDPTHQASLRSSMDLPHEMTFDAQLRWVDTLHNNVVGVVGTVPRYFELDVRWAWQITPHWEFSLVGHNLLHDQHPEFGITGPTRVEIQRSAYAKVAWQY
jgi:iron complex outermembrane receptor protein